MSAQAELMIRTSGLADAVRVLRAALHSGVWQRMTDYADGPATARLDGITHSGVLADPTAVAALSRNRSMAGNHRVEFDRAMTEAAAALGRAIGLAALYPQRDAHELLTLAKGEPGCDNCAQTTGPSGQPRWEPVKSNLARRTDVDGRLPRAVHLCRWCYDHVILWERLPTVAELELRHSGRRVPWPADVPRPTATEGAA
jgi:hypothetical protein